MLGSGFVQAFGEPVGEGAAVCVCSKGGEKGQENEAFHITRLNERQNLASTYLDGDMRAMFYFLLVVCCCGMHCFGAPAGDWKLVWSDEFNGRSLNEKYWTRCKRGNSDWNNTMSDLPRLAVVRDGSLRLIGIKNPDTSKDKSPYLTAGVTSRGKYSFQYGKVQIRARFISAQGAWPALWMLGEKRGWPANGEIDLLEHLNFEDKVYQTVHSPYTLNKKNPNVPPKGGTAPIRRDAWNTYGCEWYADKIVFTVNGKPTHTYPRMPEKGEAQWPFNQPFYFILSMQIGGDWVNEQGRKPTNPKHFPAGMQIDWVRVYQKK